MTFAAHHLHQLDTFIRGFDHTCALADIHDGLVHPAANIVALRHDVDADLERAVACARHEHANGWRASYYLLHTAGYWPCPQAARTIQDLGHEVGLHNNAYHQAGGNIPQAIDQLSQRISEMQSWGVDVRGCCDHGSGPPHNVDLWRTHGHSPLEVGAEYEAYLLVRAVKPNGTNYISDSGGRWSKPLKADPEMMTVILQHPQHWPYT